MNDLQLAGACVRGDVQAQTLLVQRHRGAVRVVLRRCGLRPDESADAEQRLWLRLLVGVDGVRPGLGAYRGTGSLSAWLRTCAAREATTLKRNNASRPRDCELLDDQHIAPRADPECEVLRREAATAFVSAFAAAVATLDDNDRSLLQEHAVDQVCIGDMAAHRGVHRTTVMRWLARIMSSLRSRTNWTLGGSTKEIPGHSQWFTTDLPFSQALSN